MVDDHCKKEEIFSWKEATATVDLRPRTKPRHEDRHLTSTADTAPSYMPDSLEVSHRRIETVHAALAHVFLFLRCLGSDL